MAIAEKPRHLHPDYGAQFGDPSIVAAYPARPPYPPRVFDTLASLVRGEPRRVLELGAGTGDISIGLAARVDCLDAVEPSSAMVAAAREVGGGATNVRWIVDTAEKFRPEHSYSLAVAAESLHWMDWGTVLPKVGASLVPSAVLAIVTERTIVGLSWMTALREIVSRFSTNRDYRTYDVVHEVVSRGSSKRLAARSWFQSGPSVNRSPITWSPSIRETASRATGWTRKPRMPSMPR
jgi:SAM-dependent methyltransferase